MSTSTEHTFNATPYSAHALISAFVDAIGTPIVADDAQGNIIHLNAAFTRVFGYTKDDIPNLAVWWPHAYPDSNYREWVMREWRERLATAESDDTPFDPMQIQVCTKTGIKRTVIVTGSKLDKIARNLTIVTFYDITEQEEAKAALRASNQQLDFALAGSALGVWDFNLESGLASYDKRWCEMLGYTQADIGSDLNAWQNLIHPEDRYLVDIAVQAHLNDETPLYQTEHRLRHKDGHWLWVLARGKTVERDEVGKPRRVTGTHLDISAQKKLSGEGLNLLRHIETLMNDVARQGTPNYTVTSPQPSPLPIDTLTPRQREILHLVAIGHSSAEIAQLLSISTATVITHRRDMMKKLGAKNAASLAKFASQ
jgi:PAS domain S-box-containing protein